MRILRLHLPLKNEPPKIPMHPLKHKCTPSLRKGVHLKISIPILYPNNSNLPEKDLVVNATRSFSGRSAKLDLNNQIQQSGGLLLADGWTAATPYNSPSGRIGVKSLCPSPLLENLFRYVFCVIFRTFSRVTI